ncbi:MAG: CBS domain-containing protein [Myxococcota bacterium]
MRRDVWTVDVTATVADAALLMRERNVGFLPVIAEDGRCAGVITDRDLATRVLADGLRDDTLVVDVMSEHLVACRPYHDLAKAEAMLAHAQVSRIVVLDDDGHVVGVISLTDLFFLESRERVGEVAQRVLEREVGH